METEKKESLSVLEEVLGAYGFSPITTWALRFFAKSL